RATGQASRRESLEGRSSRVRVLLVDGAWAPGRSCRVGTQGRAEAVLEDEAGHPSPTNASAVAQPRVRPGLATCVPKTDRHSAGVLAVGASATWSVHGRAIKQPS